MSARISHVVEREGVRLHVEVSGEGPPILVLHGFTGSCASMRDLSEALAAERRTIAVDLPGHGLSDAPADPARYALDACVADLEAVMDALGVPRASLLGYSMGGRVALGFALRRPARTTAALVIGASAGLADPDARAARAREDDALADAILRDGVAAFVDRWMALPLFATQARLGTDALARARAQRLANRPEGLAGSLRGLGTGVQPPLHDALAKSATPIRFVAGAEDAKFAALARDLAALAPRGEAALVPGAGHAAHLEQPRAFLAIARAFLHPHDIGDTA